jgi:hypothetical protein
MSFITKVVQTRFGAGDYANGVLAGNCFQASLTSLLRLELSEVPDEQVTVDRMLLKGIKLQQHSDTWSDYQFDLQEWLYDHYRLRMITVAGMTGDEYEMQDVYCLAGGESVRGLMHSCVWFNGEVVWDPHPEGTGFIGPPKDFTFIVSATPSMPLPIIGKHNRCRKRLSK